MPEKPAGLPTDDELQEMARDAAQPGSSDQIEKALREVRDRTERATKARALRWAADQVAQNTGQRWVVVQELREAAREVERG